MMQSDNGKLFIGGISWDTDEERLKEYFGAFGEIVEAVIMKDRTTGRARGFGFVVFSDPTVADRVIKEKHNIDGRMVEAKKAVPRDEQNILSRSSGSVHGSPGPGRTRKIFVGGLASTVTESDFKKYFEQFGIITDVVVMYDHNTQRPRGFGFITYDTEEAVDKVLLKTFHELNGKMVEVKRAVPKELSPGPSRSPLGGYNYGLPRVGNSFLNGYTQGYSPSSVGGYGLGRFSPVAGARSGFTSFGSGYGMGINFDQQGLSSSFGVGNTANYNSTLGYARGLNPYYMNNPNTRFPNPSGYEGGSGGGGGGNNSFFSSVTRNMWGNGGLMTNNTNSSPYIGSGTGNSGGNVNWGSSMISAQGGGGGGVGGGGGGGGGGNVTVSNNNGNLGYGVCGENSYGFGKNGGTNPGSSSSFPASNGGGGFDGSFAEFYGSSGSGYRVEPTTWRLSNPEREGSGSFSYGFENASSDPSANTAPGYVGGYSKRKSNRGSVSPQMDEDSFFS